MTWTSSMPAGWNLLTWSSRRWVGIAGFFFFFFLFVAWVSHSGHSGFLSKHVELKALKKKCQKCWS